MSEIKYLSLERLTYYHAGLKVIIENADAEILKQAKAYCDGLADNYDPAGKAQTLYDLLKAEVDKNTAAIAKLNGAETEDGSVAKAVKDAKDELQGNIDAVDEKADKNAEDITALAGRVTTAEGDIDAVETDLGDVDALSTTNKTIVGAINEVLTAVGTGGTAATVTVTTDATSEGALKSYTIKQGTTTVGVIDIPKDMVVESGEVVTNPEGQAEGTYIKLVLANVADPLFINVGTLVDIYKAEESATQIQLTIDSASRVVSAKVVAGSITATELAANAVTTEKIADANVTKAKLSTSLQASIDKADAAAPQTALDEEVARAKEAEAKALADSKAYTDEKDTAMDTRVKAVEAVTAQVDTKDAQVLSDAKAYADSKVEGVDLSGIATNASDIDAIEASLAEGGATANAIADAKKAGTDAQAEVDALEAVVGTVTEGKTVVQMIADAQTAATYNDEEVRGLITANDEAIDALTETHNTDKAALEAKDTEIAGNVAALQTDVDALKAVTHTEITEAEIDAILAEATA